MFLSYVKIAFRNVARQKMYAIINILGLAIGIAACITILLYVQDELSYDRHHEKADRIYRIWTHARIGGNDMELALSAAPEAAAILEEYPDVVMSTRIGFIGGFPVMRYGDFTFSEERYVMADSSIFDVFDIPLILGNPKTALTQPNTMVISESTAKRYFGDENPMGKVMVADRRHDRMITGVFEDMPKNSHFHYDFMVSYITSPQSQSSIWVSNNNYTYLVLKEGSSADELEAKFPDLIKKYVGPQIEQILGVSFEQLLRDGAAYSLHLQPLTDIHLTSHLFGEIESNGNILYVTIFSIIAVFILVLAVINFMNLSTARSTKRAKEVGIRKTIGSKRGPLITQFLVESIVLTIFASFLAVVFVLLILPSFNTLLGIQLSFDMANLPYIILSAIVVGLLAGSYPAFFLSAFDPVQVLKGDVKSNGKGSGLRAGLVIFQFTISIFLFTGTLIIRNQLAHMQNTDVGYDRENLLIIEKTDDIAASIKPFLAELKVRPSILKVTNSTSMPGQQPSGGSAMGISESDGQPQILDLYSVTFSFAETYGIEMASGRFFSTKFPSDSSGCVINETAAREYGVSIEDALSRSILIYGQNPGDQTSVPIIGVMKDFNNASLHTPIKPMVLFPLDMAQAGRYTALRIEPDDVMGILAYAEETWKKFAVDQAFEYTFFDDAFNELYVNEYRTRTIVTMFTILAIFIACLGLLGLASFTAEQRTKEMGIRKVLGASVANIFTLLSSDIMKLVVISTVISLPISWYAMTRWLENFAFRISFSFLTFVIASVVALIIAVLTVTWQALKAASADPVTSLRYE